MYIEFFKSKGYSSVLAFVPHTYTQVCFSVHICMYICMYVCLHACMHVHAFSTEGLQMVNEFFKSKGYSNVLAFVPHTYTQVWPLCTYL